MPGLSGINLIKKVFMKGDNKITPSGFIAEELLLIGIAVLMLYML